MGGRRRRGTALAVAAAAGGLMVLLGHFLAALDEPRRTFVALRYLATAQEHLTSRPVDRAAAIHDIKRAMAVAPSDKLVLSQAPTILLNAEDYQGALEALQRRQVSSPDELITLAHALLMTDHVPRGRKLLQATLATVRSEYRQGRLSSEQYALLLNNAAYALAESETDLLVARNLAQRAVNIMPLQPAFTDTLGWVLFKLQQPRQAAFYLERAVRHSLDRPDPVVLYHLGCVYAALNRRSEARRFLLWSLSLDPAREDAMRALRGLYRVLPQPPLA
ncbi:MAG: hypothetical protein J7M26_09075 [Armatimonadetes bacterium]|nr:hypothetical protein [Armatimonadota bacterium]